MDISQKCVDKLWYQIATFSTLGQNSVSIKALALFIVIHVSQSPKWGK